MTGTVTISVEIELGWGVHDTDDERRYDALSTDRVRETKTLDRLLSACEEWDVPISFDVVGHLLHESCEGDHGDAPHKSDWFDADPGGDVESNPHFYAPDLVRSIVDSPVEHEICTHTYSHVVCDAVSRDVLEWELRRARNAHKSFGLSGPTSLVPPRGRLPPIDLLPVHGIDAIRVPSLGTRQPFTRRNYAKTVLAPPVIEPTTSDGVLRTFCSPLPSLTSPFLPDGRRPPHPMFRAVPTRIRKSYHRRYLWKGLERANETGGHVHFWSHLYNLSNESQLGTVLSFVERLGRAKNEENTEIRTIRELADRYLRRRDNAVE